MRSHRKQKKRDWNLMYVITIITAVVVVILCAAMWGLSSPGEGGKKAQFPIYINEILIANSLYPNPEGICCDYIEFYNSGDFDFDLSHYKITDKSKSNSYVFPSGTILPPGGYVVVYCSKDHTGDFYAPFGLSRYGDDEVRFLTRKGATIEQVALLPCEDSQPMVREADGSWTLGEYGTPGFENSPAGYAAYMNGADADESAVSINEVMSRNHVYADENGEIWDWIELCNHSQSPVDLTGYTLSDNIDVAKYTFPQGTILPGNGYLVVWCVGEDGGDFRAPFSLSADGGEMLFLRTPQGAIADTVKTMRLNENESMARTDTQWDTTTEATPGYENSERGFEAYLESIGMADCGVMISELMASNKATLPDANGEFCDWLELTNYGSEAFNLEGCCLTDDENLTKWSLPARILEPGECMLVYCSGGEAASDEFHANFSLSSTGECIRLTSRVGTVLDSVTYDHAREDISLCRSAVDEVIESEYSTPGYSNDEQGYAAFCDAQIPMGPLAIWEVMTSNSKYLTQAMGKCYDWVELKNVSGAPLVLSSYSITDKDAEPDQYVLPDVTLGPGEYILIILSGDESLTNSNYYHAGFTLDVISDRLYVYGREGALSDYALIEGVPADASYSRNPGRGGFFITEPTPGKENAAGSRQLSEMPAASPAPGLYTAQDGLDVSLSAPGMIYYTLDGSTPTADSKEYTAPIHIDKTTVVRAISIEKGQRSSKVLTLDYFLNVEHPLPVISMVSDPDNLFSGARGIYVNSYQRKDIEIPAHLTYLDQSSGFSLDCGVTMHGATSLMMQEKKSFNVHFRDRYDGRLCYDLFGDGRVTDFASIVLRADQESVYSSFIRDNLMGYLGVNYSRQMLACNTGYAVLYINGEYWGIYSVRERNTDAFYASHMGFPEETCITIKHDIDSRCSLYQNVYLYMQKNSMRDAEHYKYVLQYLDAESFADWIIFQAWCANADIAGNGCVFYSSVDGKWRCGLMDTDLGMFNKTAFSYPLQSASYCSAICDCLMQNETFRALVAERLQILLSDGLSDENVINTIDMLAGKIREEIPREKARWGGTTAHWEVMVNYLREYADGRAAYVVKDALPYLKLSNEEADRIFGGIIHG